MLNKVRGRFTYGGKTGQEALEEIFNSSKLDNVTRHSSAQKFINNLDEADKLFGKLDNVKFDGIKTSTDVRLISDATEIGRLVDGQVQFPKIGSFNPVDETFSSVLSDGKPVLFKVGNEFKVVTKGSKEWFSKQFLMSLEFEIGGIVLKPQNVLEGTNGKVAIIGQSMGGGARMKGGVLVTEYGVMDYANGLIEKGYITELYAGSRIPDYIREELIKETKNFTIWLTPDQIRLTNGFKHNSDWAKKIKAEGYTIIDLGNPNNAPYSAYYAEEILQIFEVIIPQF